jgi:pimeloyl-ACP methyl ester carboxylesterase
VANPAKVHYRNPFYDGQLVRTLAAATVHAADLGEALATARRVGKLSGDSWYRAWSATGDTANQAGIRARDASDVVGARHAFLRASEYYRQAYYFVRADLDDPRLQSAYRKHVDAFMAATELLDGSVHAVRIPYEATTLKGYLLTPSGLPARRPTMVFPAGYDSTAEAGWANAPAALTRGYNVLLFEGPGQGEALYAQRLYLRPDFEHVFTPVLDWLLARPEVEPTQVALVGRSFGGYLAPRAAAFEHRIAALICDPAQPDMAARLPSGLIGKLASPVATAQARLSSGRAEFFGARMAAHGINTIADYFADLRRFTMIDHAAAISCPTLIVEADHDFAGGSGTQLQAALTCPNDLVHLTAEAGADGHCAGLGQELWNDAVHPWLTHTLNTRPADGLDLRTVPHPD